MVTMMSPDLDQVKPAGPVGEVDLAQLDDKHLSQYRHPSERWSVLAIAAGAVGLAVVLWYARPYFGDNLAFLPGPIVRLVIEWTHPHRIGLVVVLALLATWAADVAGQSARAWQLVARAVEITPSTYPQLAPILDELRTRFDLPRSRAYVSREAPTAYTVGVREPYAIVLPAVIVGTLTLEEFRFLLARDGPHQAPSHLGRDDPRQRQHAPAGAPGLPAQGP
jgi:hypothetical protein